LIRCLSQYLDKLIGNISPMLLFPTPPLIEFRPSLDKCSVCGGALRVQKTRPRIVTTLHIGRFYAREVILVCGKCDCKHRCEQLCNLVPFLQRMKKNYGIPIALVHDMGRGILKAVARIFTGVPDFICHFHFLRDIGKDFLGDQYDIIRKRLSKHQISSKLRYRAKQLKRDVDRSPELIDILETGIGDNPLSTSSLESLAGLNGYTLIRWTLEREIRRQRLWISI